MTNQKSLSITRLASTEMWTLVALPRYEGSIKMVAMPDVMPRIGSDTEHTKLFCILPLSCGMRVKSQVLVSTRDKGSETNRNKTSGA